MRLLVTGGAGFIGSTFVRQQLPNQESIVELAVVDKLTYAGNLENLDDHLSDPRLRFIQADICDRAAMAECIEQFQPDAVVHFAAESHVDRSIIEPDAFVRTNVNGTFTLLNESRRLGVKRFIHVSTDEVYGSIEEPYDATEDYPLLPSSPYSASKASSDLLALSYHRTFGYDVIVTRASNNYGPYQFPEKLIPLMISNALEEKPLPVYGDGMQIRDWLHVEDHCRAIMAVLARGRSGEIYNIAGECALPNIEVIRQIIRLTGKDENLMKSVQDRPGHDRRYALSSGKLQAETGWSPAVSFEKGLAETIDWYRDHQPWLSRVRSGDYQRYYQLNYGTRGDVVAGGVQ